MRPRALVRAAVTLVLSSLALGCRSGPAPSRAAPGPSAVHASRRLTIPRPSASAARTPLALLPYVERTTAGAKPEDALPLVLALHGRGDTPEAFLGLFDGFPARARLVAPHPRAPFGDGFTWFDGSVDRLAAAGIAGSAVEILAVARAVAASRPTLGKPIVVGFSQGGALAFHLGTAYPATAVAATFPLGGWLPPPLVPPARPSPAPVIVAFHGTADDRVPFAATKSMVGKLEELGFTVTLHEYAGVGHRVSAEERAALFAALAARCDLERGGAP